MDKENPDLRAALLRLSPADLHRIRGGRHFVTRKRARVYSRPGERVVPYDPSEDLLVLPEWCFLEADPPKSSEIFTVDRFVVHVRPPIGPYSNTALRLRVDARKRTCQKGGHPAVSFLNIIHHPNIDYSGKVPDALLKQFVTAIGGGRPVTDWSNTVPLSMLLLRVLCLLLDSGLNYAKNKMELEYLKNEMAHMEADKFAEHHTMEEKEITERQIAKLELDTQGTFYVNDMKLVANHAAAKQLREVHGNLPEHFDGIATKMIAKHRLAETVLVEPQKCVHWSVWLKKQAE